MTIKVYKGNSTYSSDVIISSEACMEEILEEQLNKWREDLLQQD